ncbi:hypothetical protein B0T22DRAFT_502185 [Podospora appendiculata]|uniref:FAD-binding domain-containing protein n=1 Tax=Podospora appendiculata TaxID=314037 RepID=A0AAE0WZX1_9PEZI|nr:hypothetical protein B0T22DRAFT_502185 [Podospora appendiculata]
MGDAAKPTVSPPTKVQDAPPPLTVAVVGGGIIGVLTALGLIHRGIQTTIYERAPTFHEIGAAMAFTGAARTCMEQINPSVLDVLRRVGQPSPHEKVRYWDGFHPRTKAAAADEASALLFDVPERDLAFWACLRSHFLLGMAALLPDGAVEFGKELVGFTDGPGEGVVLRFADGTTAAADVLIGCDGIHSATRPLLLGADHPSAHPTYTHKTVFRALVPFPGAVAALGADKAHDYSLHLGPNAHMISFPVQNATLYNLFVALHDPAPWPDAYSRTMTAPSTRSEVATALRGWGPHVAELVGLLPDALVKYGVFDMAAHPAPTYARGRVCVAGDAAHASSPFHGAGACMGVEDALVLADLLARVQDDTTISAPGRPRAIEAALQAFSAVRKERSQWLVQSSRDIGDIYQWRYQATGEDSAKCKAEFEWRARKIGYFDVDGMVADGRREYEARFAGGV